MQISEENGLLHKLCVWLGYEVQVKVICVTRVNIVMVRNMPNMYVIVSSEIVTASYSFR